MRRQTIAVRLPVRRVRYGPCTPTTILGQYWKAAVKEHVVCTLADRRQAVALERNSGIRRSSGFRSWFRPWSPHPLRKSTPASVHGTATASGAQADSALEYAGCCTSHAIGTCPPSAENTAANKLNEVLTFF